MEGTVRTPVTALPRRGVEVPPVAAYFFFRVAQAPAACPSVKWALKPP